MLFVSWFIICLVWIVLLPSRASREKYTVTVVDFDRLQEAVEKKTLSVWDGVSIIVKMRVFPVFLITYLLFLLIAQTHIFNLHYNSFFLSTEASWLLWMTIASWIVSVLYNDQTMQNRTVQYSSHLLWWVYSIVCGLFWILGSYILFIQINEMTSYAYIVATIWWIACIVFGLLLVEEQ